MKKPKLIFKTRQGGVRDADIRSLRNQTQIIHHEARTWTVSRGNNNEDNRTDMQDQRGRDRHTHTSNHRNQTEDVKKSKVTKSDEER